MHRQSGGRHHLRDLLGVGGKHRNAIDVVLRSEEQVDRQVAGRTRSHAALHDSWNPRQIRSAGCALEGVDVRLHDHRAVNSS